MVENGPKINTKSEFPTFLLTLTDVDVVDDNKEYHDSKLPLAMMMFR